jgi:hypothetical protein
VRRVITLILHRTWENIARVSAKMSRVAGVQLWPQGVAMGSATQRVHNHSASHRLRP